VSRSASSPEGTRQAVPAAQLTILIVTSIHPPFDKRIWRHATELARRGHDVIVVAPWPRQAGGLTLAIPSIESFEPTTGLLDRLFYLPIRVAAACRRVMKTRRIDIIHFHDIDLYPVARILGRGRAPMVYDVHENFHHEIGSRVDAIRERIGAASVGSRILARLKPVLAWMTRTYDRSFGRYTGNVVLVAPSQLATHARSGVRVTEVRNYASAAMLGEPPSYEPDRGNHIVFTGSHYEDNGSLFLLEVAAKVAERVPEVRFTVTRLGLEEVVDITRRVPPDEIFAHLNSASIGLIVSLPTDRMKAGIPTRLFEYMAAGLPVVAPSLPLISEVLSADASGILVEPANADAFADAIAELLADEGRRQELSAVARLSFLNRFTWESQVDRLEELYSHLESSRTSSTGSRRP